MKYTRRMGYIIFFLSCILFALFPALMRVTLPLFLFFLPGFALLGALKIKSSPLELLSYSVLASILSSTYIIYFICLFMGYSEASIYVYSMAVLLAAVRYGQPLSSMYPSRKDILPLFLGAAVMLVYGSILYASLWIPSSEGVTVGGWNYGDFFHHIAIIRSVNSGNFPPEEPVFSGEKIIYHWFLNLHTAILSKFGGMSDILASIIDSTVCVGLLALLTYLLSVNMSKNRGSAVLAVLLVVFSGGLGYVKLLDDLDKKPLTALLKNDAYDNDWTYFQIPSMLPGFLLPQRAQAVGMPLFAAAILLMLTGYQKDRSRLAFLGILIGFSPLFNYYAFVSCVVAVVIYAFFSFRRKNALKDAKSLFYIISPGIALSLPFLYESFSASRGMFGWNIGWMAPKDSILSFMSFYAANLGIVSIISLFSVFLPGLGKKRFLAALCLALFLIPNICTFSNPPWGMVKFFSFLMLPLSILAAAVISKTPQYLWPVILLFCCLSAITGSVFYVICGWTGLTNAELDAGAWMTDNTPQKSVFASASSHNLPIDSVSGRLRILGFEGWVINYGMDYRSRKNDMKELFCGPRDHAGGLMEKYGASYVYSSWKERSEYGCEPYFRSLPGFAEVYSHEGITIYSYSAPAVL